MANELEIEKIKAVFNAFESLAEDFEVKPLTSGHINRSFLVHNAEKRYVLQKINTSIFKNSEVIMQNIRQVAMHLRQKKYPKRILEPIPFSDGHLLHNKQWRLFHYFENTLTFEKVESEQQAFEAAKALSQFHSYLIDVDSTKIEDAIPGFLDFENRFSQFETALVSASKKRLDCAKKEIETLQKQQTILADWQELLPKIPKRIIHADPKISNFLFDLNAKNHIIALIDWDTLMHGPILYDFGDMVRSYTNTKAEDDPEPGNNFSKKNYDALKKGFLHNLKNELTKTEIENLDLAAKVVIYIQAIRFLTDYLNGDTYYAIQYPEQNLNRTKNQLNLLQEMHFIS